MWIVIVLAGAHLGGTNLHITLDFSKPFKCISISKCWNFIEILLFLFINYQKIVYSHKKINEKLKMLLATCKDHFSIFYEQLPSHVNKLSPFIHNILKLYLAMVNILGVYWYDYSAFSCNFSYVTQLYNKIMTFNTILHVY